MLRYKLWFTAVVCVIVLLLAGCGDKKSPPDGTGEEELQVPPMSTDPVTLTVFGRPNLTPETFESEYVKFITEKYPHITFDYIRPPNNTFINELIVTNNIPDVIFLGANSIGPMVRAEVALDIRDKMRLYGFDLDRIDQSLIAQVRNSGSVNGYLGDEIYAMPGEKLGVVTVFNKTIFDEFGVDYPKDGLTWDDVLEYGRRLTREVDGKQYQGAHLDFLSRGISSQSLRWVDPVTKKASFADEGWLRYAQFLKSFYDIPNMPHLNRWIAGFVRDLDIALIPANINANVVNQLIDGELKGGLDYDFVSYPVFKDHGTLPVLAGSAFVFNQHSPRVDVALRAFAYLNYDPDVLKTRARNATLSVLNDAVYENFGIDTPLMDKNMDAMFYHNKAGTPVYYEFTGDGAGIFDEHVVPLIQQGVDIGTALRRGEELIDQRILEQMELAK